ncbi:LLM class flavin-dependent oxidoreductase [Nakamurella silvestris]|nr:LLM class flavin-dependent oxidoreductase [Nakamurella silvestris]
MEIGLYSFGEVSPDPTSDNYVEPGQRLRNLVEEITLADQVGLDVFGLGEHHRPDFPMSAPAVVLAAAASVTSRIRLTSAVTVLSSADPVRVFQEFATLDQLSNGRAEIMAGRGSFIESFPLFGYDLADYDELFAEKLDLLLALNDSPHITWQGKHRPSINGRAVHPRPLQDPLPIWIAVGGNPESVIRAASLGVPMALAVIGGDPARFVPYFDLYRQAAAEYGHNPATIPLSLNLHGFIADTEAEAVESYYPGHQAMMGQIARERGFTPPSRAGFEAERSLHGSLFLGSPDQIIEKILLQHSLFGHDRFLMQTAAPGLTRAQMLRSIELLGTVVAPAVRQELGRG